MHSRLRCCCRGAALSLVFGCFLGFTSSASAAAPSLGSISPWGAQRGKEVEVQFNGARLSDAQEILFYYPGIKCTSLEVVNDNSVKSKLAIDPECRLGIHAVRVRTATGISELRTFMVGNLPEVNEVEPNNDFAKPQAVALDSTVVGVADNEDVDFYVVEAKKGERITAEVEGIRLGITFFDPYVSIMDMGRFELSSSDDSALVWQDGVASIVAPEDGKYVIQVRESSYAGNGACIYRCHVGRFPRPSAAIPAGGKPGETIEVHWLGDVLGEKVEPVTLPAASPRYGLFARDGSGVSPSPNVFHVGDLGNVMEVEPNNAFAEGTPCEAPIAMNGVIGAADDVDCFKFPAKQGQVFDVRVIARGLRSPLDSVLSIYTLAGNGIGGNDDSGGPDSYLRFQAPADDTYVVSVRDHLGKGGPNYAYRVEVAPVKPTLTMGLPERQQYVDVTVSVPKGNRTAFLVSAGRGDFGGDLNVDIKDMPPGVTLETMVMAANQTIVPVLLTAAPDAALAGSLADVVGRHADPAQNIEGHLSQTTGLVRGQNNILFWGHTADRMALAVTDEAPFRIEVVQPKVPLVRDGSMGLKVVATRKEGFTAPIAVRMLYDPPGVGSSGGVSIPEGQTEAVIPVNANGGAEIRTWKIAVMGEATVGNGPVLVSSQLADLEVSEPFFSFGFQSAAVEKGKETEVVIKVTKNKDFEGPATVELLGLPHQATTQPGAITKETGELVFKVATTAESPVGRHPTLICRAVVTANGEPITHSLGTGELRIDEPIPPKADAPPPPPMPAPMPVAVAEEKPPEKRLTRLEKLRLEREQAKQGAPAPAAGTN